MQVEHAGGACTSRDEVLMLCNVNHTHVDIYSIRVALLEA